ncbi:MotA/TolQ/ExbB proton channel family protein [Ekhidna sp.]
MIELFQMGGILFMSILTIEFVFVMFFAFQSFLSKENTKLETIKSIGLLSAITGVLGQLIGLFSAFEAIQEMGSVTPAMLAGGFKVSMITTMYGLIIYLVSLIIYIVLKNKK